MKMDPISHTRAHIALVEAHVSKRIQSGFRERDEGNKIAESKRAFWISFEDSTQRECICEKVLLPPFNSIHADNIESCIKIVSFVEFL